MLLFLFGFVARTFVARLDFNFNRVTNSIDDFGELIDFVQTIAACAFVVHLKIERDAAIAITEFKLNIAVRP